MRFGAILIVTALTTATGAEARDVKAFDGAWDVTVACPQSAEGAKPFSWSFAASVSDGRMHGVHGEVGQPGSMALDGVIRPDGSASLEAHGLTGAAQYNVNQAGRGAPFRYPVKAHFDAASGAGSWVAARTCPFTFAKR